MSSDHGAFGAGPAVRDTEEAVDQAVAELQTAGAVRTRAHRLLERARAGESRWFVVHDHALDTTAADVAEIPRIRFPDLDVPVHSRWNHFQAGGYDRRGDLDALLDLVYNVGEGNVSAQESPRLNAAIAAGDYETIADELRYTTAAGKKARGLEFRSERRVAIFEQASYEDPREQS